MRGLAAAYVLVFHFLDSTHNFVPAWLAWFTGVGWSGVDFFFVLTGYLLATLYTRPSKPYFIRRVFRTFPLYYASLPLYAIAGFIVLSPAYLVYAQDYFVQTFSNTPLWTLTLEELFYFVVFPLILVLNIKSRYLLFTGLAAATLWALLPDTQFVMVQMPEYFICYAAGIFIARNEKAITRRFRPSILTSLSILCLFLFVDLIISVGFGGRQLFQFQPALYAVVYGLVIVFMKGNVLFTNRVSHFLGKISYGVYILQIPVLWIIAHPTDVLIVGPIVASLKLSIFVAVPLAGLATLLASTASFYLFESPLVSLGRRLSSL